MPAPKGRETAEGIISQMQTLESKLNLIAQRIKTMEKNEEILGRTLITLNDKLDKVSREGFATTGKGEKVDEVKYATKQEVRELKALLDAINPLEFATVDQVKELMDDALKKRK
jgi:archaellum component FlaC